MPVTINGTTGINTPGQTTTGPFIINAGGNDQFLLTDGTRSLYMDTDSGGVAIAGGPGQTLGGIYFQNSNGSVSLFSGNNLRLTVDSSGRVTMPAQPAFLVGSSLGDTTISANAVIPFDTVSFNTGSGFSTGTNRFTAPIAGRYFLSCIAYYTNSDGQTQSMQVAPYLNGSQINVGGDAILFHGFTPNSAGGIGCFGGSVILNLAANDYVTVNARGNNARLYLGHTKFSGYLLG
jgi:hypothetical protein